MHNLIKLEIFSKNKDFDTLFNDFRDKYFFSREDKINEILGEKVNVGDDVAKNSGIYGCPYADENRHSTNFSKISHVVEFICKENGKYYGYISILDTQSGRIIKDAESGNILKLRPVYRRINEILSFDIYMIPKDLNRNNLIKKILQR